MTRCCFGLLLYLPLVLSAGEVRQHTDPDTGLLSWQIRERGFSMQLLQVLPDYVRATYSARGLPPDIVETIAGYCVFGTIVTNDSQQQLSYRVADWRYVTADSKAHPLKTKTQWVNEWKDQGVAFRWSILPALLLFPGRSMSGCDPVSCFMVFLPCRAAPRKNSNCCRL